MSEPTCTYDRGIARVTWAEPEHVEMTFDTIRTEHRTGDVSAEVTIIAGTNGTRQMLRRTRLNLSASQSRSREAADLANRKRLDWSGLLEIACWKVIDVHRAGRPPMLLRDAVEPPGGGLLLPPLLVKRDPVVIFGDGGNAKSYTGLALGMSIHTGTPLVGYMRPLGRMRVAYLDWEWNPWPHKRRMRALWGDGELPDLVYVPCNAEGPLVHQVDRLRRVFHAHQVEYAVIDSVALACDGKPEDAEVALAFFQALARLEVGACLLAHVNRLGDPEKPFGSAFWHNSARLTWNVQKAQEAGEDGLRLTLFNRKANDGPLEKPLGLRYEFGERTVISCAEVSEVAARRKSERQPTGLRDRLADLLRKGDGATYEDAAMELSTTPETIRDVVKRDGGRTFRKWDDPDNRRIKRLGLKET